MIVFSIEAFGETLVQEHLLRFSGNLAAPEAVLSEVGTILRDAVRQQFDSEGGQSGGWKQLSEGRVQEKARLGLDPRILRATGALMESLVSRFDPRHIEQASGSSLTFGSSVPYAIYHQSSRPRTKIPFRPMIALTRENKRLMLKAIQRALIEQDRAGHATWGA